MDFGDYGKQVLRAIEQILVWCGIILLGKKRGLGEKDISRFAELTGMIMNFTR